MMLEWKDGRCTNPPPPPSGSVPTSRWEISATLGPGWSWLAGLVHDDAEFGVWCPRSYHEEGYCAESAAQWACEAALLRLGVLPLPGYGWAAGWPDSSPCKDEILGDAGRWSAVVSDGHCAPRCSWSVFRGGAEVCEGLCETRDAAKAAAERHLRAELAAWLDAQAATEEA